MLQPWLFSLNLLQVLNQPAMAETNVTSIIAWPGVRAILARLAKVLLKTGLLARLFILLYLFPYMKDMQK